MAEEKETNYISVSGKQIGVAMAALLAIVSSPNMVNRYVDNVDAHNKSSDWKSMVEHVQHNEISISQVKQIVSQYKQRQEVFESRLDNCRTSLAGIKEKVINNKFLITQCLRITGQ